MSIPRCYWSLKGSMFAARLVCMVGNIATQLLLRRLHLQGIGSSVPDRSPVDCRSLGYLIPLHNQVVVRTKHNRCYSAMNRLADRFQAG